MEEQPEDIQMELLPLASQDEVPIVHHLFDSRSDSRLRQPITLSIVRMIARVFASVYVVFYALLAVPLTVCYCIQLASVRTTYQELSAPDKGLRNWFLFGLCFALAALAAYSVHFAVQVKCAVRSRLYYILFFMFVLTVKLLYYSWALDGIVLYLGEVKDSQEDIQYVVFMYGLTFLSVVNLMDAMRMFSVLLFCSVIHCYCKVKAERFRRAMVLNPEQVIPTRV